MGSERCLQGNLDPCLLYAAPARIESEVRVCTFAVLSVRVGGGGGGGQGAAASLAVCLVCAASVTACGSSVTACFGTAYDPHHPVRAAPRGRPQTAAMLRGFGRGPVIANLGHGMLPDHDPAHLGVFIDAVHAFRR